MATNTFTSNGITVQFDDNSQEVLDALKNAVDLNAPPKMVYRTTYLMNGLMYADKKISQSLYNGLGVQFPSSILQKISFNTILHTVDEYVKGVSTQIGKVIHKKVSYSKNTMSLEELAMLNPKVENDSILEEGLKALKGKPVNTKAVNSIAKNLKNEFGFTIDRNALNAPPKMVYRST